MQEGWMQIGKVQARGQVTLTRETRRAAGIKPGDTLAIEVVGPGEVRCRVMPALGIRELRAKYPIEGPIDWLKDSQKWEAKAAQEVLGGRSDA
jgi:bifunctional DNA-binding transcriptional regulator/antitoxin component of YhaV-PrlF toxin-antitoxin module